MTSALNTPTVTTPFNFEPPNPKAKTGDVDPLANKETFLQLLVAQIKNQNPMSPQDGVQFLSQLAQFTDLEQSLGMRQDIAAIKDLLQATTPSEPAD
jgi:flagellar basal-body rod modification protein FlgD